eukprot:995412-Pelagomonas_calceolata.AAC.1
MGAQPHLDGPCFDVAPYCIAARKVHTYFKVQQSGKRCIPMATAFVRRSLKYKTDVVATYI